MESAGGCGGHGATEAQCSAASDLCQQCRTAVAARADTETEDGAAEGALLSSLDVGFLELHCVLPQWHDACQSSVADLGFALLLLAGGLLMLLAAGGLLLFDWYALPGLVSAAKPLPPSQAAAASKVGQPQLERCTVGVADALRMAAAVPMDMMTPQRLEGMPLAHALRHVFLFIALAAVVLRVATLVAFLMLVPGQRQLTDVLLETLLCLLPFLWCACSTRLSSSFTASASHLAFCGPGQRLPRFTTYAVLTVGSELYSTLVLSYAVATAPCDVPPWKPITFYCFGVLVAVIRCYSAVVALRLQDAAAGACRRILPKDACDLEPVAEGDIQCSIQDEELPDTAGSSLTQADGKSRRCWRITGTKDQTLAEAAPDVCRSPSKCCPARQKLWGRRLLIRVAAAVALVSAVASAVIVRAVVGEAAAPVQPSSCGVARNSTTTCVPWRLAGVHLVDRKTGELQMDLTNTLEECCSGCDGLADCQAWIFERMAKRCRWIQFDDAVCRQDPGDLRCRCYTNWGTAYGFKPKSSLVWLTAT
ncbi:unnamed protein product [Symbiodinium pilosum]|uniref:Apple domain-containing protein n=1 Tax=Symbiodinium pilosum TaxID=2952 RepID=A0A812IV61_SYMPI|nr:unnamed protein product [Symbiodinium pilosum]